MDGEETGPPRLDPIFANLGREIRRPLDALRGGLELLLIDPAHAGKEADVAQAMTLLGLCDDLRHLTDDCLGAADQSPAG